MKRRRIHSHPCADCLTPVDCDGELEQNHDGGDYHPCDLVDRFPRQTPLCESCAGARQQAIRDEARVENDR